MKNFLCLIILVSFSQLFLACTTTKYQQQNDHYLPDLRIKNAEYRIYQNKIENGEPGRPKRTIRGLLLNIGLSLTIENIGSGDWNSDLCILCTLEKNDREKYRSFLFEDLVIPFASSKTIFVKLNDLIERPGTITINLNPQDMDSSGCGRFSEENFYDNNSFKLYLNKLGGNTKTIGK